MRIALMTDIENKVIVSDVKDPVQRSAAPPGDSEAETTDEKTI